MASDLEKLFRLVNERKYRIKEIQVSFNKTRKPKMIGKLTLERNGKIKKISSSEEDFISYVSHLHSIPHIEDDYGDFVYIDNPEHFFDIEKKIVDMFSGEQKEFIICERSIEVNHRVFPTKICQIFYDVGVLMVKLERKIRVD